MQVGRKGGEGIHPGGKDEEAVVTVRDDVEAERAMLADSLQAAGAQEPTACGDWTAFDLAAHVVSAERAAGVLAFGELRTL